MGRPSFLPDFVAGGPPPTRAQLQALVAAARRTMALDVAPPLYLTGRNLRLDTSGRPRWAKVAWNGTNYGLTEQQDNGSGGWTDLTGGLVCSACAWEANKVGALGGVYRVHRGRTGEWRFVDDRFQSPCTAALTVLVFGCPQNCGGPFPGGTMLGAVITVKDSLGNVVPYEPGVSDTCTVNTSAACTWTNVTPGATYTVHVDPAPGYVAFPDQTTSPLACNNNVVRFQGPTDSTNPNYGDSASDHACCVICNTPLPRSLTLDDGLGTVPLSFTGYTFGSGNPQFWQANWAGSASRMPSCDVYEAGTDPYGNPTCLNLGRRACLLDFQFNCFWESFGGFSPSWAAGYRVSVTFQACSTPGGTCYLSDSGTPVTWSGAQIVCGIQANGTPYPSFSGFTCNPPYLPVSISAPCTTFNGDWISPCPNGGNWPCVLGPVNIWSCFYSDGQNFTVTD